MTIEEAREDIPDIQMFLDECCNNCKANDWYCPTLCDNLEKAKRIPFEKILKAYARHDGDLRKISRYIKKTKEGSRHE